VFSLAFEIDIRKFASPEEREKSLNLKQAINSACVTGFSRGVSNRIATNSAQSPIDPMANTLEFVLRYSFRLDGKKFDFERYPYLAEIYRDNHPFITLMQAAQTGKTGFLLSTLVRWGCLHWGESFAMYFPGWDLTKAFSSVRFKPFVLSQPFIAPYLGKETSQTRTGEDSKMIRTLGRSKFFFFTITGKASTESFPIKGLLFDELRGMDKEDVQKAEQRTSSYDDFYKFRASTARYPEQDIDAAFQDGDQRYYHTDCKCSDGVILAKNWPECFGESNGSTPSLSEKSFPNGFWLCPKCGEILRDPQVGNWRLHNPGAESHSYQVPKIISPAYAINPKRLWAEYTEPGVSIGEFYNSGLGLAYVDEDARILNEDNLIACVNPNLRWEKKGSGCAIGVDVQRGYLVAVVKRKVSGDKFRTIHVDVLYEQGGKDCWEQLDDLMVRFDSVCVIDDAPEYDSAFKFAERFRGRVWLAHYIDSDKTGFMISWGDKPHTDEGQKKVDRSAQLKFTVSICRFKFMEYTLGRWKDRMNECADPDALIKMLPKKKNSVILTPYMRSGEMSPVEICRKVYWKNLTNMIKRQDYIGDKKESKTRMVFEAVGDDHFAHADLYCNAALLRVRNKGRIFI